MAPDKRLDRRKPDVVSGWLLLAGRHSDRGVSQAALCELTCGGSAVIETFFRKRRGGPSERSSQALRREHCTIALQTRLGVYA